MEQTVTGGPAVPDTWEEVVQMFERQLPGRLAELAGLGAALQSPPWDAARAEHMQRLAHRMKGSSATFGMEALSCAAAALEESLKPLQGLDHAPEPAALARMATALNHLCALGAAPQAPPPG